MPKYNHMIVVAFEAISDDPNGDDLTVDQLCQAMQSRIFTIRRENSLDPFDIHDSFIDEEEQ